MGKLEAAVLVADISGFTRLTESMGAREAGGVELLTRCLNSFFGQMIELVRGHGGDVMRFAGDSMICCFSALPAELDLPDGGLEQATLRCLQCATALVQDLGELCLLAFVQQALSDTFPDFFGYQLVSSLPPRMLFP